jgi:NAD(P)H-hydrate epimerase
MKVLSAAQIREADKQTILNEPITSLNLMERAATKCSSWITEKLPESKNYIVICGPGNNGGDGLAIARMLWHYQKSVTVYYCNINQVFSVDFSSNKIRLEKETDIKPTELNENNQTILFEENAVIIDCILGSGLNRKTEGWISDLIKELNQLNTLKISIDIPSGLFADDTNHINGDEVIFKADYTLTFQLPKLSLLLPEGIYYAGEFIILSIGLDYQYINKAESSFFFIQEDSARQLIKKRPITGHKGTFGHAYLIGGSAGFAGAAALCSKAAIKSGCGLVTTETALDNDVCILNYAPEIMVQTGDKRSYPSQINPPAKTSAIGIGPGIGNSKETNSLLKLLLNKWNGPLVLDADALNVIADDPTLLSFIPTGSILTPHPGEFDRLFNLKNPLGIERLRKQIEMSTKYSIYILLKGYRTSISSPKGRVYFNSTGNNGMATAGCGDVLTGIITSLVAQGYYPLEACILGTYIHGLSGDIALNEQSEESLTASELINNLGKAFKKLKA